MNTPTKTETVEARNAEGAAPRSADVTIEKLVYGGEGLARLDGQVLLAPFVLPGELVRVLPERAKTGLLRGHNPDILQPSAERVHPPCEYFGRCGGCHYQHASYPYQLQQKEGILRETLQRIGHLKFDDPIHILSAEPWHYRNRVQLHFAEGRSGFHRAGSHKLQPIDHCPISSPALVEVIRKIAEKVREPEWPRFLRTLELFTNEQELQLNVTDSLRPVAARFFDWCAGFLPSLISGPLKYRVLGLEFLISRGSFFQVNRFLTEALVTEALSNKEGGRAVDLYAGVGLFSLPLAARFHLVDAVERGKSAYGDLMRNGQNAGRNNLSVHRSAAEEFVSSLSQAPDLVLADPPRAGLGPVMTGELLRLLPAHIVLVSCDPATLSRDLAKLQEGYRPTRMALVDLFPQTYHFETVVHLERK